MPEVRRLLAHLIWHQPAEVTAGESLHIVGQGGTVMLSVRDQSIVDAAPSLRRVA